MGMDTSKSCQLHMKDLTISLEKMTGAKFHLESMQKAEKIGLLQITADDRVLFPPSDLARILVNIIVYKRLEKLEDTHRQKKMKNESAA